MDSMFIALFYPGKVKAGAYCSAICIASVPDEIVITGGQGAMMQNFDYLAFEIVERELHCACFRQDEADRGLRIEGIGVVLQIW